MQMGSAPLLQVPPQPQGGEEGRHACGEGLEYMYMYYLLERASFFIRLHRPTSNQACQHSNTQAKAMGKKPS